MAKLHELKNTTMYLMVDETNRQVISRHRSIDAAERARLAFLRAVQKKNGRGSYVHTAIMVAQHRTGTTSTLESARYLTGSESDEAIETTR